MATALVITDVRNAIFGDEAGERADGHGTRPGTRPAPCAELPAA